MNVEEIQGYTTNPLLPTLSKERSFSVDCSLQQKKQEKWLIGEGEGWTPILYCNLVVDKKYFNHKSTKEGEVHTCDEWFQEQGNIEANEEENLWERGSLNDEPGIAYFIAEHQRWFGDG